ncbi:MAG: aminoacyl-tRNA hydrolase [Candidatus Pacebacteria bacterium]|nr:aminoacyl-tRNA hydrolase [Candidatus Paceibacterota bacterium]PIR60849.1 MAG: aminoacyl-tRNA hydrolase [Candidatus Pacebacteria bacterium CG10_big_fil_rev_8_21_14_0_10_44_54]
MTIIIGLGNPGSEHRSTRHSIGRQVLDKIAAELGITFESANKIHSQIARLSDKYLLIKPETYMNDSGRAVVATLSYFSEFDSTIREQELQNLFVVHDDLDIILGEYKLQFGTGPKGHNGLLSLYQQLKTKQFWHMRVGVDGREGLRTMAGSEYVLQQFLPTERAIVAQLVESAAKKLLG